MKSTKIISLVLSLVMIIGILAVIPATTVSAAVGEVWTLTHTQTGSPFIGSIITHTTSSHQFTVDARSNSKNSIWDNHFLLTNGSDNNIDANTTYRIMFDVSAQNKTIDLYTAKIGHYFYKPGVGAQVGLNMTTYNNLTAYAEQYEWGDHKKYHVAIDYTTPAVLEGTAYGKNSYLDIAVTFTDIQNTPIDISNIRTVQLGTYTMVDGDNKVLGTVNGLPGDATMPLVLKSAANNVPGLEIESVSPETIAADTTRITVNYAAAASQEIAINFDSSWGGASANEKWAYLQKESNGRLTYKTDSNEISSKDTIPTAPATFGDGAVLLANNRNQHLLTKGNTYRATIIFRTTPLYCPLENFTAEVRFHNTNIYGDKNTYFKDENGNEIRIKKPLKDMVTGYEVSNPKNGTVRFTLQTYITMPSSANSHPLLSIYGGNYTIESVTFNLVDYMTVVDEQGATVTTVGGSVGDKAIDLIPDSFKSDSDYVYSTEPEIIANINDQIILKKALKPNLVQKIAFGSLSSNGGRTYSTVGFSKDGNSLKAVNKNYNQNFSNTSVALSNDIYNNTIEQGKKYRVNLTFRTQPTNLDNYRVIITQTTYAWENTQTILFDKSGQDIQPFIKSATSGNTTKYNLVIDVETKADPACKHLCLAIVGKNANDNVSYWLDSAYILKESQVSLSTYNEEYFATATGFEGDEIGDVVADGGKVKFRNVTDKFAAVTTDVKWSNLIYRGDANADGVIDDEDLLVLRNYLLGITVAHDTFGVNAKYNSENVDIIDLIHLNKKVSGLIDDRNLPETLRFSDYQLAWNYEFDEDGIENIDQNYISSDSGDNNVDGLGYLKLGAKDVFGKTIVSDVNNGVLKLSPKYAYGAKTSEGDTNFTRFGSMAAPDAISTRQTMNFKYGYFEIRAKLPYSAANLPAIWFKSGGALDTNQYTGTLEYDLLETFGSTDNFKHNVHYWADGTTYNANNVDSKTVAMTEADKYHTYGFDWYYDAAASCSKIDLYVDGVKKGTLSGKDLQGINGIDFDRPMYLIISNQIITQAYAENNSAWLAGRGADMDDFPMDMCIDYIRIYQSSSNPASQLLIKSTE